MSIKIGITGGIGSGKSYVCSMLKKQGIPVYSCDNEAKRLMTASADIRTQLSALIANAYNSNPFTTEWQLNKAAIAHYLFADKRNADRVNAIVHPVVKQDFLQWADRQNRDIVAQESAILFESGFDNTVDFTVEVYAPQHIRLSRAMSRDAATSQQIEARMAQQMPEEEKRHKADFCIVNDGIADLSSQIVLMLQAAKEAYNNKIVNKKQ